MSSFSHATAPSGSPRNPFGNTWAAFRMPLHRQVRQGTLLEISEQLFACHCTVRFAKEPFWKYVGSFFACHCTVRFAKDPFWTKVISFLHATAPSGSPRNPFGNTWAAFRMPLHRQVRQGTLLEIRGQLFACHCTVRFAKEPFWK